MQRAPQLQWVKFSLMLLTLGAFISILIYVLVARDELTAANVDVPIVKAPDTPTKRRPENPGGMDIPNRDRVVFNLLEDANEAANQADETIAEDIATQDEDIKLSLTDVAEKPAQEEASNIEERIVPQDVVKNETPQISDDTDMIANLLAADAEQKPSTELQNTPKSDKIQQLSTANVAETAVNLPKTTTIEQKASGNFGIQLASFAQKSDAEQAVQRYQDKFRSQLSTLTPDIQRADLGAKGIRYRVRFLGSETSNDANELCKKLKALGQGCFPVSK